MIRIIMANGKTLESDAKYAESPNGFYIYEDTKIFMIPYEQIRMVEMDRD